MAQKAAHTDSLLSPSRTTRGLLDTEQKTLEPVHFVNKIPVVPTAVETVIRNVQILDGSGGPPIHGDVALLDGKIAAVGTLPEYSAENTWDGDGLVLAPGFIDTHTHDDLTVIAAPEVLPKISQGVTTVIVGNCGVSASPYSAGGTLPEPMSLLGKPREFRYRLFEEYASAIQQARPSVNVAALIGHTTLRANHMGRLDRSATSTEIEKMCAELHRCLQSGAIGLSTGLAYPSAYAATTSEVIEVCRPLAEFHGVYATHLRSETGAIFEAIEEAISIGSVVSAPVVVSHLKCAGVDNWGKVSAVLERLDCARRGQSVSWDCYPYAASSSLLDLRQVDERVATQITWSQSYPEAAGRTLREIAEKWGVSQLDAAKELQPAGAIYHCMSEADVQNVLRHPETMIGSDGLPCDPHPHPRLWGSFPRVLGRYCRSSELFSLGEAVRKMTSLPAEKFRLLERGRIRQGFWADLVLFDPHEIADRSDYLTPKRAAVGVRAVWVNGVLSYDGNVAVARNGRFLRNCVNPLGVF
jgi:N-acyl-D-amino-acid deacylase